MVDRRVEEISAIYEISQAIHTKSIDELLFLITEKAASVMDADACSLMLTDGGKGTLSIRASFGLSDEIIEETEVPLGVGVAGRVAATGEPMLVNDLSSDMRFVGVTPRHGVVSSMCVPLMDKGAVRGVLNIRRMLPKDRFSDEDLKVASVFASQAALAIANRELYTALNARVEELASLSNYTDNILRSISTGVVAFDPSGRVRTWNKAAEGIFGAPAGRVLGEHYSALGDLAEFMQRIFEGGERYRAYKEELCLDGRESIFINVGVSRLGGSVGIVAVVEDVTANVRMENEVRRVSELAATGELAANIAHEIRNPLSSIKGAAQFLRQEYDDQEELQDFLDIIIDEVDVLNGVTTEFLEFARPAALSLVSISANDLVERSLRLMLPEIEGHGALFSTELAEGIPDILVDERQIDRVLRNLVLNALQAMQEGGRLSVATLHAHGEVGIRVSDTGDGIDSEDIQKIFTPFFTTKTKGTGLGLSIVKRSVGEHGGRVVVESEKGVGTAFTVWLPVTPQVCDLLSHEAELYHRLV